MVTDIDQFGLDLIQPDRNIYMAEHGADSAQVYDGTLKYLLNLHEQRKANAADFSTYHLPELPESEADIVFQRIREAEQKHAAPRFLVEDYDDGVAQSEDELLVVDGLARVILTAEHATRQMRTRDNVTKTKEPDYGTAGLGTILQEDTDEALIIALGRQTGDANDDPEHPLKDQLGRLVYLPSSHAHLSLHQSGRTQVEKLTDQKSFGVMVGIGNDPTPETLENAEKMVEIGKKYDVRVGINQPFIKMEPKAPVRPIFKEDGILKTVTFAAANPNTTRAFSQQKAADLNKPFSALQAELSNVLLHAPLDWKNNPGEKSQRMGVYLGYLIGKEFVELLATAEGRH